MVTYLGSWKYAHIDRQGLLQSILRSFCNRLRRGILVDVTSVLFIRGLAVTFNWF